MHTGEPVILEAVRMQDRELYILPMIVTIVNQNLSVIIYDDYFTSLGLAIILKYGVDKFINEQSWIIQSFGILFMSNQM